MEQLTQIETLSLREYLDKEMTRLRVVNLERLDKLNNSSGNPDDRELLLKIMCDNARGVILQEIAHRLEYGFITEIGKTSLKHHLPLA